MNRLANEQRLQIIEFYYQNACSAKKIQRALLPFYGQFNRPTEIGYSRYYGSMNMQGVTNRIVTVND